MTYPHEPRRYGEGLYCLSDGEPWPCSRERLVRSRPRHTQPHGIPVYNPDCPACQKAKALLAENRAEADAILSVLEVADDQGTNDHRTE